MPDRLHTVPAPQAFRAGISVHIQAAGIIPDDGSRKFLRGSLHREKLFEHRLLGRQGDDREFVRGAHQSRNCERDALLKQVRGLAEVGIVVQLPC